MAREAGQPSWLRLRRFGVRELEFRVQGTGDRDYGVGVENVEFRLWGQRFGVKSVVSLFPIGVGRRLIRAITKFN